MQIQTRKMHGFTLIELMICIAVAALLFTVSAPALGSFVHGETLRTSRNALVTSLNMARNTAITRHGHLVVCPSTDQRSCTGDNQWQHGWIVFEDKNGDSARNADEPVLDAVQAQAGIAIVTSEAREHVTYHSDGSSPGTNLTFTFCDGRGAKTAATVIVGNSGRPRQSGATEEQGNACIAGLPERT
jgi:type IV fimbrial biogenesis protein FimT